MKTWSDGLVESWSVAPIRIKAVFQYSNIPIPRSRLCLTVCAVLFALSSTAQAQQAKIPRIGYLTNESLSATAARGEAFRQGLRELGYVEGKHLVIEWRSAEENSNACLHWRLS